MVMPIRVRPPSQTTYPAKGIITSLGIGRPTLSKVMPTKTPAYPSCSITEMIKSLSVCVILKLRVRISCVSNMHHSSYRGKINRYRHVVEIGQNQANCASYCLLYTSDAADEEDSVDLGGRRIIKKKKNQKIHNTH